MWRLCENTVAATSLLVAIFTTVIGLKCNEGTNCILLDDCTGLYTLIQKGNSTQYIPLLRSLHCGFEGYDRPKICCPPGFLLQRVSTTTPPYPFSLLPSNKMCGIQYDDRILGGIQTDIGEHSWIALLRYDKPHGSGYYCGGVLISEKYVLTAAHCVKGADLPSTWKLSQVRLGEWNISSPEDCIGEDCSKPVQDILIEEIIAHEAYDPNDKDQQNDIALLRLSEKVKFNDFEKPICLPLSNAVRSSSFEGYNLKVAGWGKSRTESNVKLRADVPVVSNSECATVYKRVDRQITDLQLCAGQDSCRGDSGGPLMGPMPDGQWIVLGVNSYGPSCGMESWPIVYTRVGAYIDWILSNLRP